MLGFEVASLAMHACRFVQRLLQNEQQNKGRTKIDVPIDKYAKRTNISALLRGD